MASSDVQLLSFWPSPYSMRVEVALLVKGVHYINTPEDLRNKSRLLLDSNPVHKKIPVLLHRGKPVCESLVIIEYIDEAFPSADGNDFLPKDPYDRAVARFWADFVDKKILATLYRSIFQLTGDERKAAIKEAKENFGILDEAFKTVPKEPPFFGGAKVGYVDIVLSPLLAWQEAFEAAGNFKFEFEKLPHLAAWKKAIWDCSVAEALPAPSKVRDFFINVRLPMAGIQIEK